MSIPIGFLANQFVELDATKASLCRFNWRMIWLWPNTSPLCTATCWSTICAGNLSFLGPLFWSTETLAHTLILPESSSPTARFKSTMSPVRLVSPSPRYCSLPMGSSHHQIFFGNCLLKLSKNGLVLGRHYLILTWYAGGEEAESDDFGQEVPGDPRSGDRSAHHLHQGVQVIQTSL